MVTAVPPAVVANLVVPLEVEDSVIVWAAVVGLLRASCSATVMGPRLAVADAVPDTVVEVITNLVAAPDVTVSVCVPEVSPLAATVMVGVPDLVSPLKNCADDEPAAIDTEVMDEPPEVAANVAVPVELDERVTVSAVVVELANESCSVTVIGPRAADDDATPDTAVEVTASWLTLLAMIDTLDVVAEARPEPAADRT